MDDSIATKTHVTSAKLTGCVNLRHAFMTRSLLENFFFLEAISVLGFSAPCTLNQEHGNKVVALTSTSEQQDGAISDGVLSQQKGVALAIKTADCLPILMYDKKNSVMGALHCGWRPVSAGIVANAFQVAEQHFKAQAKDFICALGPCISASYFEVGLDVVEAFRLVFNQIDNHATAKAFVNKNPLCVPHPVAKKKYLLNLQATCVALLLQAGVRREAIDVLPYCTYADPSAFYSHRRDATDKRLWSLIEIYK